MGDGGASRQDARREGAEAPDGMKHICVYLGGQVGYEKRYIEEAETLAA